MRRVCMNPMHTCMFTRIGIMQGRIGCHVPSTGTGRTIQTAVLHSLGRIDSRVIQSHQKRYCSIQVSESHHHHHQERECASTTVMSLQQGTTSISIPLSVDQIESARDALRKIIGILSEKQQYSDAKPKRWESVDVTLQSKEGVCVNVFCNPNACMNAFDARVLLTVEDPTSGIKVTMTDVSLQEFQNALSD